MGDMDGARQFDGFDRAGHGLGDGVVLRGGEIFVVLAAQRQDRAADARHKIIDAPIARTSSPSQISARRLKVGPALAP